MTTSTSTRNLGPKLGGATTTANNPTKKDENKCVTSSNGRSGEKMFELPTEGKLLTGTLGKYRPSSARRSVRLTLSILQ
jgi:hypothetical protein